MNIDNPTLPNSTRVFLPDETDHMAFEIFAGGAMLVTSCLEVSEPTEFCFAHDPTGIHISAQFFLSGEATIVLGDGQTAMWTQDGTSVVRSDTPGFRLLVAPGQVLRHVCVALYHDALTAQLGAVSSANIQRLMAMGDDVNMVVPVPTQAHVRATAESLYALRSATGIDMIKAESLAIGFLYEVLERFGSHDLDRSAQSGLLPWQTRAVRDLRAAIDADPAKTLSNGEVLERFQMGEQMARRLFQAEYGVTIAVYARTARLTKAREALSTGRFSVKQVGFDSGYGHIGNFTRAYRRQFGENPSETRRNALLRPSGTGTG